MAASLLPVPLDVFRKEEKVGLGGGGVVPESRCPGRSSGLGRRTRELLLLLLRSPAPGGGGQTEGTEYTDCISTRTCRLYLHQDMQPVPPPGHAACTSTRTCRLYLHQDMQTVPPPGHADCTSTRTCSLHLHQDMQTVSPPGHAACISTRPEVNPASASGSDP
ncbi:unnamed protein product [Merluccius merluccius]